MRFCTKPQKISNISTSHLCLNVQVAYKRVVAGPKKWRPELIIVKMAVYIAKAKVTLVFWTQALSHSLQGFSIKKNDIKTVRCI